MLQREGHAKGKQKKATLAAQALTGDGRIL